MGLQRYYAGHSTAEHGVKSCPAVDSGSMCRVLVGQEIYARREFTIVLEIYWWAVVISDNRSIVPMTEFSRVLTATKQELNYQEIGYE